MTIRILILTLLTASSCSPQQSTTSRDKANQGSATGNGADDANSDKLPPAPDAVLKQIKLALTSVKIPAGFDVVYTATGDYDDATTKDITDKVKVSISDEAVATLNSAERKIRGIKSGKIVVTASVSAVTVTSEIEFTQATLASIDITPKDVKMPAGGSGQLFKLNGTFSDGSVADISPQADWTSSNAVVADINNIDKKGFARGKVKGTVQISSTFAGKAVTTSFEVEDPVLMALQFDCNPSNTLLEYYAGCTVISGACPAPMGGANVPGGSMQTYVSAYYSDCSTRGVTAEPELVFTSITPTKAAFSTVEGEKGKINFLATGAVTASASYKGKTTTPDLSFRIDAPSTVALIFPGGAYAAYGNCFLVQDVSPGRPNENYMQFTVRGLKNDCSLTDLTSDVTWSVSDATIGGFDDSANPGRLIFYKDGKVDITATFTNEFNVILTQKIVGFDVTFIGSARLEATAIPSTNSASVEITLINTGSATATNIRLKSPEYSVDLGPIASIDPGASVRIKIVNPRFYEFTPEAYLTNHYALGYSADPAGERVIIPTLAQATSPICNSVAGPCTPLVAMLPTPSGIMDRAGVDWHLSYTNLSTVSVSGPFKIIVPGYLSQYYGATLNKPNNGAVDCRTQITLLPSQSCQVRFHFTFKGSVDPNTLKIHNIFMNSTSGPDAMVYLFWGDWQ